MSAEARVYEVKTDGFIMNQFYRKGDVIKLSDRQAKYYLPPLDDRLVRKGATKSKSTVPSDTKVVAKKATK